MSDPAAGRDTFGERSDDIEDAVIVDDIAADDARPAVTPHDEPTLVEANTTADGATVEAEFEPDAPPVAYPAEAGAAPALGSSEFGEPRVVYVTAPVAPAPAGNRWFGVLIACAATVAFAIIFVIAVAVINAAQTGRFGISFIQQPSFYVPIAFFLLGSVVLALVLNRAGWAAHVVASILVGVVVYFGTIGVLLLINGIVQNTPAEAQLLFGLALTDPRVIASGLVAREVSLWTGALVAKRGRKVTERNRDSRARWQEELAEKSARKH
ncbi:MAG: hypothetical protein ACOH1K_00035 [Rhodoglobus sp.]